MLKRRWRYLVLAATAGLLLVFGVVGASADFTVQVSKGCVSPTYIGDPYNCHGSLQNQDGQGNSYIVEALSDRVNSTPTSTADLFALHTPLIFQQKNGFQNVSCTNGTGTGTALDPFIPTATTKCTLPGDHSLGQQGGKILVGNPNFSHYTVQAGDFPVLTDNIQFDVSNACDFDPGNGCTTGSISPEGAQGNTLVLRRTPQATTTVTSGGQAVTAVAVNTAVVDTGTVSEIPFNQYPTPPGPPALPGPVPTGSVTVQYFTGGDCGTVTGTLQATSGPETLDAQGNFTASDFAQTPTAAGQYSFQATYPGDGTYKAATGPCEPFTVVDASITLTPNGVNAVGSPHTFTCTISVNNGSGPAAPPVGTNCAVSIINGGPGTITGSPCQTNAAGSCTVTDNSTTAGLDEAKATTTVTVLGVSLTRSTTTVANPTTANCQAQSNGVGFDPTKCWVNASITLTPNGVNAVGSPHTFTCTISVDNGSGPAAPPVGTNCAVSIVNGGPGTITGSPCQTNAAGSCTVTDNSTTAGLDEAKATATVTVLGQSLTRSTTTVSNPTTANCQAQSNGVGFDPTKCWVDASITLTPNGVNAVGSPHTFTCTISVNDGSGPAAPPVGTNCAVSIVNGGPGTITGSPCQTNAAGSCTVTDNSTTAGLDEAKATATVTVLGQSLTRSTTTVSNPTTTNCQAQSNGVGFDPTKCWVDASITLTPNGVNAVGSPHTFTCTISVNTGSGPTAPPVGTLCAVSIVNGGPGAITGSPCQTNAAGSCTVTDNSTTPGLDEAKATTTVTVLGQSLTRSTTTVSNPTTTNCQAQSNGVGFDPTKCWADDIVTTRVRDAAGNDITGSTSVPPGMVVHDEATVAKAAGTSSALPGPTGTVDFTLYGDLTCDGNVIAAGSQAGVPIVNGLATMTTTFTTPASGTFSYKAHYNGQAGIYPQHDATTCEPFTVTGCVDCKAIVLDGQSMEGALKFLPGSWVNAGWNFKPSQATPVPVTVTVAGFMYLPVHCGSPDGPLAGNIKVPLDGQVVIPAGQKGAYPNGGNQNIAWLHALRAPDLCGGGLMYNSEGANFGIPSDPVNVSATAHNGVLNFQFHYRIPAAKGKGNLTNPSLPSYLGANCTDPNDAGYNKADVCGASWSATKEP